MSLEAELRWERRARELLQRITVAAAEATAVAAVLEIAVREVCRTTGWPVGHVLVRDEVAGDLVSSGLWSLADSERFQTFHDVSAARRFAPGEGLPGRVLASGKPLWIIDVTRDPNFPRAAAARDLGVRSAFGFPVSVAGQVHAVLEFFSPEPVEPDVPLLEVMASVGTQLGRVIERARAEEALRSSELRFRSVAQTATDAIITADGDGCIVTWNAGAERMFGYSASEVEGQSLTLVIPERFREQHQQGLARLRSGGASRVIGKTVELPGLRRGGEEFPLELSLATWSLGEAKFFTGILRDITRRKEAEAELHRVAARLEDSERAAVEANRAKSLFLANMSHELRTPLNAILGFAQLIDRDRGLSAENRESLAAILRSAEHLLGLINDVLSISKIEAGHSSLHTGPFDLPRLIDAVREMFHLRAEARGLQLVFDVPTDLPRVVRGDEGKLRQVLINLIGNAVKFTEAGGVAVRVAWRDGRATLEVQDTGPGMNADELERLFEPFTQAAAGRRAQDGTGLGLAISHEFVARMGGTLAVRSEPRRGTTFTVELALPAAPDATPEMRQRRVSRLAAGQPDRKVLVVDNAPDQRRLLARLLTAVGFATAEAGDGREAIEAWRRWQPDFIWMDMRMPVLDGYAATREIRRAEAETSGPRRTVIVALTASAFEHDRAQILAAGCDDIVSKPFREATVFATLARLLGVEFIYEAEPGAATPAPTPALTAARVAALPAPIRSALAQALAAGDDLAAIRAAEGLLPVDPEAAREVVQLIKGFRIDELLTLLERAAP